MAINNDLGLKKMAQALGLKRKFFESDRSLARRVVAEMGETSPISQFFKGLSEVFAPPVLVKETFNDVDGYDYGGPSYAGYRVKEWSFHYSDGVVERVASKYLPNE